jgi:homoserine/homoserine lactone efflux protein
MQLYPLYVLVAAATIASPGPGVVMTLTNAARFGLRRSFGGILGVAIGALCVAAISATSLGVLLATSAKAFMIIKMLGAAYLLFLGWKLWRSPGFHFTEKNGKEASFQKRFMEGISLQLTNPKAIFFFLSIFPQFINTHQDYRSQFALLLLTHCLLTVGIHCMYALCAGHARQWLSTERGGKVVNRAGALTFMFFGAAMATAKR